MRINFIKSEKPVCSGGPTTIVAWAGKDASKFFNEIHKGVKSPGFAVHVSNVSGGFLNDLNQWFFEWYNMVR